VKGNRPFKEVMLMRRIALLSISIALVACPGCASFRHPTDPERQPTDHEQIPAPRLDLSRVRHAISDWAER
jgi:hypothetical protein